jgi:hypothetical protein
MLKAKIAARSIFLTIGLLTLAVPTSATTVIEQTFPDLVHKAEVIAVGTVTGIQERRDPVRQAPFTDVTFSQLTVLKGDPGGASMTLEFLGGHTPDGTVLSISGVPSFTMGEKTVVFCAGNHRDFCPLVGVWQGLLRVTFDPQRGVETVSDNFRIPIVGVQDGAFLKLTPEVAQQDTLSLSALIQLIEHESRSSYGHP